MEIFEGYVESIAREAIEQDEFEELVGAGMPIDLTACFETPTELRVAYSALRNSVMIPREIELAQDFGALQQVLETTRSEDDGISISGKIRDLQAK